MTDYARQNDFSVKDALAADNPAKVISGQDVDDELDAIVDAVGTKANSASPTFTGTTTFTGTVTMTGATLVGIIPAGTVAPYAGSTEPSGWVFCDGSAYNSTTDTTFADLYTAIANVYGGSDGTDFQVPDLRGRTVFGADNMDGAGGTGGGDAARLTSGAAHGVDGDTVGSAGGVEENTLVAANFEHKHETPSTGITGDTQGQVINSGSWPHGTSTSRTFQKHGGLSSTGSASTTLLSGAVGSLSADAISNLPGALVLNYIIKK